MINIRRADASDADAIARVRAETWRTAYRGIIPDEHLAGLDAERERVAQRWRENLAQSDSPKFTFVAESPEGVVGFAAAGAEREGNVAYTGEIGGIYILEAWQKQGIGRSLVAAVIKELQRRGHNSMLIWVLKDNPCRAFYERLGGAPVSEKETEIGGKKLLEVGYGWSDLSTLAGSDKNEGSFHSRQAPPEGGIA